MLASNLSPTKSFELSTHKWLKAPAAYYCLLDKEGIIQEQDKGICIMPAEVEGFI